MSSEASSDFFQNQENARKRSRRFLLLFVLAMFLTVFIAPAACVLGPGVLSPNPEKVLLDPAVYAVALELAIPMLLIVGIASLHKIVSLSSGGPAVAKLLGAVRLDKASDPSERRLIHVVEEMAIASGISVPDIYILEEEGINAFAAGYGVADAVVGVTRAAVQELDRDELQSMVAHEFSHILNGDMRLSVRLIGGLFGLASLAMIGRGVLRLAWAALKRFGILGILCVMQLPLFLGIIFYLLGFVGEFFARMMRGAFSRQREHLADSASVQFTRNPAGLIGALKRISAHSTGALLSNQDAEQMRHMFFADSAGYKGFFGAKWFATHPPLLERIWSLEAAYGRTTAPKAVAPAPKSGKREAASAARTRGITPEAMLASIGVVSMAHMQLAHQILADLPESVLEMAHEASGAPAVVCALLLSSDDNVRKRQVAAISESSEELSRSSVQAAEQIAGLQEARLPLVEVTVPALKRLSEDQYRQFRRLVLRLVKMDGVVDPFEILLLSALESQLEPHFKGKAVKRASVHSFSAVKGECSLVLSCLAHAGQGDPQSARAAFDRSKPRLHASANVQFVERDQCQLMDLIPAFQKLRGMSPPLKKSLLETAGAIANDDGIIYPAEAELLRTLAYGLDVPVPPGFPVSLPVATGS